MKILQWLPPNSKLEKVLEIANQKYYFIYSLLNDNTIFAKNTTDIIIRHGQIRNGKFYNGAIKAIYEVIPIEELQSIINSIELKKIQKGYKSLLVDKAMIKQIEGLFKEKSKKSKYISYPSKKTIQNQFKEKKKPILIFQKEISLEQPIITSTKEEPKKKKSRLDFE